MYNLKPIKLAKFSGFKPITPVKGGKKKKSRKSAFPTISPIQPISIQPLGMPKRKKRKKGTIDFSYQERIDHSYDDYAIPSSKFFNPFQTKLQDFKPMKFGGGLRSFETDRRVKQFPREYPNKRDMSYSDAWNMYRLKPFGDIDRDGVPNWRDCKPYDNTRDGKILDAVKSKVKTTFKRNKKTPNEVANDVALWEEVPKNKSDVWEPAKPDKPNPKNAYKTAYPEVWEEGEEWEEDRTDQETSLVPVEPQPGVEYGGPVVPYQDQTLKRTDEIVPYGEKTVGEPEPEYVEYVEYKEGEPEKPPMKWVGGSSSADDYPDTSEAQNAKPGIKDRLSGAYEGVKNVGGAVKDRLQHEEQPWDGIWRLYFRQKKGNWQLYGESPRQSDIFETARQLESQAYIAEVWVDKRPPDDMLNKLNRRVIKERFMGEVKDITEKTTKGVKKVDKDVAKEIRKQINRYGGGTGMTRGMKQFMKSMDVTQGEAKYRSSGVDKQGTPRGYDLGMGRTRTAYSQGYSATMRKPKRPNGSWWDTVQNQSRGRPNRSTFATRQPDFGTYEQQMGQQSDMYQSYDYENSPRTVPPNMFGNGRVDRYNPVTARQSFVGQSQRPQQPQQGGFRGFQNENRPRGLGMTGGQRTISGRNANIE